MQHETSINPYGVFIIGLLVVRLAFFLYFVAVHSDPSPIVYSQHCTMGLNPSRMTKIIHLDPIRKLECWLIETDHVKEIINK